MNTWRTTTLWGLLGGGAVGVADASHVVATGRLGLGAVGIVALVVLGALAGALFGVILAAVGAWAGRLVLRDPPQGVEVGALVGALAAAAARLQVEPAIAAGLAGAGLARATPVVGVAALLGGGLVVLGAGRWRHGRRVLFGVALLGLAAWGALGGISVPAGQPAGTERPSVLIVTIDGARADRYLAHGLDTPGSDRLATEGTRFALAIAPGGPGERAADDLLRARPPVPRTLAAEADVRSLAVALGAQGYVAGAFLAAPVDPTITEGFHVVDDDTGWPLGLSRTLPGLALRGADLWRPAPERRAHDVVDRAIRFVKARPGAFLAWVHLRDPLPPYDPPVPFDERYAPAGDAAVGGPPVRPHLAPEHGAAYGNVSDPRVVEARYDGEIASVDAQLARLLDALDVAHRTPTTLVVVVGVEGTQLAEAEPWFGRGPALTDGVLHVPAALRLPGRVPAGEVVRAPVELADVGATVFDLLGIAEHGAGGVSLKPAMERSGVPRAFARAATPDASAVRFPGALLSWSKVDGYRGARLDGEAQDGRAWTAERVRDELGRLPGTPPAPTEADVRTVIEALQRRPTTVFEASFTP